MRPPHRIGAPLLAGLLLSALASARAPQAGPRTGFAEAFAYATDRAALIERDLAPGSPDAYFYRGLLAQHEGRLADADAVLAAWLARYPQADGDERYSQLATRQALLVFDHDPARSRAFLRDAFQLDLEPARGRRATDPPAPSVLDPQLVSGEAFMQRALAEPERLVEQLTDRGLERIADRDLSARARRDLLDRLERPDLPGLVTLVVEDLAADAGGRFGKRAIHARLLLDQLDACASQRPSLLADEAFVRAYVQRLAPGADEPRDAAETRASHLERLARFVDRLGPAFDSLRAQVTYHQLALDLESEVVDRGRLERYLRLPRAVTYGAPDYQRGSARVPLDTDWGTGLPPIEDDEALVREALALVFVGSDTYDAFVGPLRREVAARLFAEAKLLAGAPDRTTGTLEGWAAMLTADELEALKARVELTFPRSQPRHFPLGQPVDVSLDVKNVAELTVRVFEVDTLGHFGALLAAGEPLREIDVSLNLDGLVPHVERTERFDEADLRRVRRTFRFDDLDRPGVYVLEFIGNGTASRAVIQRGALTHVARISAAGHVVRVYDASGTQLTDASVTLGSRTFAADAEGEVTIPFSTQPGERTVILQHGDFGVLARLDVQAEDYRLEAKLHVEREALLPGGLARLLIRPRLLVGGARVSLALLEDVTLHLVSTDLDGARTTQTVRGLSLADDRETVHELRVPARLRSLEAHVTARVPSLSLGASVDLASTTQTFPINGIDLTDEIASALLTRSPDGFALDLLGKNGEALAGQAVTIGFEHRDFQSPISVQLAADGAGRVSLGRLPDIAALTVTGLGASADRFELAPEERDPRGRTLHVLAGQPLRVPLSEQSGAGPKFSLIELRGGAFASRHTPDARHHAGYLELAGLEPGDYSLAVEGRDAPYSIRVTSGAARAGYAPVGGTKARRLQLTDPAPLAIASIALEEASRASSGPLTPPMLAIQLSGGGQNQRVHVFASRYLGGFRAARSGSQGGLGWSTPQRPAITALDAQPASFEAGRRLSDEYRYILDRRNAPRFAGNMLPRPGVILNPWALALATHDASGVGGGAGGAFGGRFGGQRNLRAGGMAKDERAGLRPATFANLDFLGEGGAQLENLRPDREGKVRVPLSALRGLHLVEVVAVDDSATASRLFVRPEAPLVRRDRRYVSDLPSNEHFVLERRLDYVPAGARVALQGTDSAEVSEFGSLASIFELYRGIAALSELDRFRFLVDWPALSEAERLAEYSEHASHEVDVFLHQKDPAFFDAVIKPYIANKSRKDLIDLWLLDRDLARFRAPWAFAELNTLEQILLLRGAPEVAAMRLRDELARSPLTRASLAAQIDLVLAANDLDARGAPESRSVPEDTPVSEPMPAEKEREEELEEEPTLEDFEVRDHNETDTAEQLSANEDRDKDLVKRRAVRALFRDLGATRELAERGYWGVPRDVANAHLITPSPFWLDFAKTAPDAPFVSTHFPSAARSVNEALFALAFLDLPFTSDEQTVVGRADSDGDGDSDMLTAKSGLFVARRGVRPAAVDGAAPALLVGQDTFRLDQPFVIEDGRRRDRFVTGTFERGVPYGCRVVVTNPSANPVEIEALVELPGGALPVRASALRKSVSATIGGYRSFTFSFAFYFPTVGSFEQLPLHVSVEGALAAFASPRRFEVVEPSPSVDSQSWESVAQRADLGALIAYLERANLARIDLSRIAWRMPERAAFDAVTSLLSARQRFDAELWSYSVLHGDARRMREWIEQRSDLQRRLGGGIECTLASVDAIERGWYEHLEYEPLINGRAHPFAGSRAISNEALRLQYERFLERLVFLPTLSADDLLEATYYLLLQDRIDEALAVLERVEPTETESRIQYDYMRVNAAFYRADAATARGIAAAYATHPVARWRARFQAALAQLAEADGTADPSFAPEGGAVTATPSDQLAATEPSLEVLVRTSQGGSRLHIQYTHLTACEVLYRPMDLELLFSTSPFLGVAAGSFRSLKPARTDALTLPANAHELQLDLPLELSDQDLLIEVRAGGVTRQAAHYSSALAVRTIESYGQVEVRHAVTRAPLPRTYVKVYARLADGTVRFHKDGYTDIRGRFDYASVSGAQHVQVERFALYLKHDEHGAELCDLAPPQR
ncbi:MAG: hypothetical protein R3F49_08730 [Planctomycetota bacterium]